MKIAVFVSNRTTFPQEIVRSALVEVCDALQRNGLESALPPTPAVSCDAEGCAYAEWLKTNPCDGVLAVFPNFGDEGSCFTALRDAGVPILVQAYPDALDALGPATRRDSFCGKISAVNLFRQAGVPCTCLAPHTVDPKSTAFDKNLQDFAVLCRVVNGMRHVRTGAIGARCSPFKTVRFDECALERLGITNEVFDLSDVFQRVRRLDRSSELHQDTLDRLRRLAVWPEKSEVALERIAALATVLRSIVAEYRLDALALRCWMELEEEWKISPCAALSLLNGLGIPANCEVDIVNALAMRILSLAADAPSTCLDWNNNYGDDEDCCILFHCGPTAPQLMSACGTIVDHPMFARVHGSGNGLGCNQGRMRPGRFTCAGGMTREGRLRFFLDQGEFLSEELPKEFFGCGGIARFSGLQDKMLALLHYGFPHHTAVAYGQFVPVLREAMERYLGYEVVSLKS